MSDDAPNSSCLNCGAALAGPYCAACGQRDLGTRVDLSELAGEFLSETFELEGRLPRTVGSLAVLPGHYLDAYLAGRRRSFSSPIRLYLAALFVLVLAVAFRAERAIPAGFASGVLSVEVQGGNVNFQLGTGAQERVGDPWTALDDLPDRGMIGLRSLEDLVLETCPIPPERWADRPAFGVETLARRHTEADLVRVMVLLAIEQVPSVLVALVGVMGLALKALWFRHPTTVHAVTAVTLHALAMIALTAWLILPTWWVAWLMNGWLQAHALLGLRAAYGSGWPRTWLAFGALASVWVVAGFAAVLAAFLLALVGVGDG